MLRAAKPFEIGRILLQHSVRGKGRQA